MSADQVKGIGPHDESTLLCSKRGLQSARRVGQPAALAEGPGPHVQAAADRVRVKLAGPQLPGPQIGTRSVTTNRNSEKSRTESEVDGEHTPRPNGEFLGKVGGR
jgi:hypothetical protein